MKINKNFSYVFFVTVFTILLLTVQQASLALNATPVVIEELRFRKVSANYNSGGGIQVVGDLIFEGSSDVNVYNISDIANPFNVTSIGDVTSQNYDFVVDGDYLYTSTAAFRAEIYDISDITNPQVIYTSPFANDSWNYPQIEGNILYSYRGPQFEVRNVQDPTSPVLLDSFEFYSGTSPNIYDFVVEGSFVYAIWGTNPGEKGLVVLDVRDPTDVKLVGGYNDSVVTSGIQYNALTIQNGYAYVGVIGAGMQIFNVGDPTNPTPVGEYQEVNYHGLRDIAIYGPYVITAGSFGFRFLDVSDFSNIVKVVSTGDWPLLDEVEIVGDTIFANMATLGGVVVYSLEFDPVIQVTTEFSTETSVTTSTVTEQGTDTILVTDTTLITETTEITNNKSEASFNYLFYFAIPVMVTISIGRRKFRN